MKLIVEGTPLKDLKIINIDYFKDHRGFFIEPWHKKDFARAGIRENFIQDSLSRSKKGVIRGLHYQDSTAPMPKLIWCTKGKVFYVALDIRSSSPTFSNWFGLELSEENKLELLVPTGFAIGMATLSNWVDLNYKQAGFYTPSAGKTILWNDPDIGINWPKIKRPILSEKDRKGMTWKTYLKNPDF